MSSWIADLSIHCCTSFTPGNGTWSGDDPLARTRLHPGLHGVAQLLELGRRRRVPYDPGHLAVEGGRRSVGGFVVDSHDDVDQLVDNLGQGRNPVLEYRLVSHAYPSDVVHELSSGYYPFAVGVESRVRH